MQRKPIQKGLEEVLRSNQRSQDIADETEFVQALVDKLVNQPSNHLKAFSSYLQADCDLTPTVILSIAEGLLNKAEVSKILGVKIINFWLMFKIYETLDIHRGKQNQQKRKRVAELFYAYEFGGSNLLSLLTVCCDAVNGNADELQDMVGMVNEGRTSELELVFYKEPEQVTYNPDKSIEQQLRDLIADFKVMPENSLERELQREIILAHVQKNKGGKSIVDGNLPASQLKSDMEAVKAKYMEECISVPSEIQELFQKARNPEQSYESLCALKNKIFSINVLELQRLINKTDDARGLIENKDVLFMIGNTGSGKSTNILKFLGYNLKLGKFGKLTTLVPTGDLHKDHKTFYTSPEAKSCTRYINAVAVPDKMYKKGLAENKKTLVICDSPGFGDSAGVEVDIANGVGMINALHGARSVRVVVILPFDSLTGDRMAGAIKMSEIISNLFHELTVVESIAIYFNKVPADKIAEIPSMIESKMKHLTEIEKSNGKLVTFLKEILDRSRQQQNFIDPLSGDYYSLFQTLVKMPPITDVRESFQYEFTESTKRQIDKFVQGERSKVKEYFSVKKYKMAQFHLQMIYKMMNILHNNDKIKGYYDELVRFVQDESEKELTVFEELISEIMNSRENPSLKAKLEDSKVKIIELEGLFKDFEGIYVVSASKIDEVIQEKKERLLDQFDNISDLTAETIMAAKSFSALIDRDLQGKLLKLIEKRFNEVYNETEEQIRSKDYDDQTAENLKILSNLAGFSTQLAHKSAINNLANRLRDIKTTIGNEVEACFTSIVESITKNEARITENTVKEVNQKIERVKAIESLKFLDDNSEIRNRLDKELRGVQGKCKRIIRDLEGLKLTLNEDVAGNANIDKDQLRSKKRQIELLMKIENLEEGLTDDYRFAMESIGRKLRENVDILNNCITALKSDKNEEIYKSLDNIKKATNVVLQCSQIVGESEGLEIAQSIGNEFIKYLSGVLAALHQIEFKLSQINDDTLKKIRQHHSKIESYGKMGSISQQVGSMVETLKNELNKKLKAPFDEFFTREVPYLQDKKHYRFIPYNVDKFERFSNYALNVDDIVSKDQYAKISESEPQIKESLLEFYKAMEEDIEDFLKMEFGHNSCPSYLKDLVKTLLTLVQKPRACDYLTFRLNFEVREKVNNIENHLRDLKDKMQTVYDGSQANAQELQDLLADCKSFGEIEDVYRSKGEPENKFGFRELQRLCQKEFNQTLKSDEQRCKQIIQGNKSTKIFFEELKVYYDKFLAIKSQDGVRKRRIITSELRKVEQKTLQELKEFRHEMDNLTFVENSSKIDSFLEALNEAVDLEKNLRKLYSLQEDRDQIEIKQIDIHKIGVRIISVFESQFEVVTELLKNYNLNNIDIKLKTFGQLETMIYEVFDLDQNEVSYEEKLQKKPEVDANAEDIEEGEGLEEGESVEKVQEPGRQEKQQKKKPYKKKQQRKPYTYEEMQNRRSQFISKIEETPNDSTKGQQRLMQFIKQSIRFLRGLIESHPYIKEAKITAKSTKRLKNLLDILKGGVRQEIKNKYENEGPNFTIDESFHTFYSHSNEDKKNELKLNVEKYLQGLHEQYTEKYNSSTDLTQTIKKNIESAIKQLPVELKVKHSKAFEQLKKKLIRQNDDLIIKASTNIISNPTNIANFFKESEKAKNNNQGDLHKKWVKRFTDVYSQEEQKEQSLDQKLVFVQNSLIEVYARHRDYLDNDKILLEELKRKYMLWLEHLTRIGKKSIEELHEMVSVTGGNDNKKGTNYQPVLMTVFKVQNFVFKLKDDIMDHTEYRKKFVESYESRLNEVVECYKETLKNQPSQKLNEKEILDSNKMKKLQNYVEDLSLSGAIIQDIKLQVNPTGANMANMKQSQIYQDTFQTNLLSAESYLPVLQAYENQIGEMLKFIVDFDFCSDVKRNFTPKEIEEDLNQLDRFFEILQIRQDFFLKYIIKHPKTKYIFANVSNGLIKKFETYYKEAQQEIIDTFKTIDGEPAMKVNLLIKQLALMRGRDQNLKFVPAERVKECSQKINKMIKQKFDTSRDECIKSLENAKGKFNEVSRETQSFESRKRDDVTKEKTKFKNKFDAKVAQLRRICEQKVKVQTEQAKKQVHRKALATEENTNKNVIEDQRDESVRKIEDDFDNKIRISNEKLISPVSLFALALIKLQRALIDIFEESEKYKKHMEAVLEGLAKISPKFIKVVESCLSTNSTDIRSIGKIILTSSKTFANFNVAERNKLIKGQDIAYVLKHLERITLTGRDKVPDPEMKSIESMYKLFKQKYDEHKDKYKTTPSETTIKYMLTPLRDLGVQIKSEFYQSRSPLKQFKNKIQLLAGIFALWAIIKADVFEGDVEYTIEPHPTQITTLILLLGISHPDERLTNRLAQVGTGQGKSIVLAGLSCYLALVGFKVRCACYSSYLSTRDQESFKELFERLGVENSIKYGTFNQLCEDILNGSGANLKDEVERMVLQPPKGFFEKAFNVFGFNTTSLNRGPNQIVHNPTILVIDEVDVFFEDSFFGNTYCPAITLKGPAVSTLLEYVWREVQINGKEIDPSKLTKSKEFDQLTDRYPTLKALLKNQVHGMIAGALNYKHDYFIIDKRIGYKDNDSISYKVNYGFKTVFAYLYEFQCGRVARAHLDEALQISLMVAQFSYAALPKYFANILGVTGTLEVLPLYKKQQLSSRYHIKDQYAIPSAFGINKKRIEEYHIIPTSNYNQKIVDKINNVKDNRPIIIFFKGPRELNDFFNCKEYQTFLKRTYNLTEEHDASVRDSRIFNAVEPGKITLMSSAYGRGTDFVVRNDEIKKKGGLHIIHAFLSLDESEEVQIKGRTARQNGEGSYDCIIDDNWLQQLTLTPALFPKSSTPDDIHSILLRGREDRIDKLSETTIKMLVEADGKHDKVVAIFSKEKLGQEDLINYISALNKYPSMKKMTVKTVLGLDATGSMSAGLRKACEVISTAFERTYAVLHKEDVKANVEVKIMIYRNYNSSSEQIIQGTAFQNTPIKLREFLNKVGPSGGWGNEALEVLFQRLNREDKLDQVIVIGDAAPNTQSDVTQKRAQRGERYWVGQGFPPTQIDRQLQQFKSKNCPVHCFYLPGGEGLANLSRQTGGTCSRFNLHSGRAAEDLTAFVVENILSLIGKNSGRGSTELVEVYRKMFVR